MRRFLIVTATALAFGAGSALAADNGSYIDQLGDHNNAYVTQEGRGNQTNFSSIGQVGFANDANVYQGGRNNTNTSTISQHSWTSDNVANVTQEGASNTNTSAIAQTGAGGNTANVWQHGFTGNNFSSISQNGFGNAAGVNQR